MDLLPEATRSFERAYWAEVSAGGRPWVLTLAPCNPLTCLFACYSRLEDKPKALYYGVLMVDREWFNPPRFESFFKLALSEGRQQEARRVLYRIETCLLPTAPDKVIGYHLAFWNRFHDVSELARTERLLVVLVGNDPNDEFLSRRLRDVRRLLEAETPASRKVGPRPGGLATTRADSPTTQESPRR
jgi:hypothetical protein